MKKLTLLLLLLTTTLSFAQLKKVETIKTEEIGKVQPFGAPMNLECQKKGDEYTIRYKDAEFPNLTEYREFSFKDVDNTFEDLYAVILDGFEKLPEETIKLELPDYIISLEFKKSFGVPVVRFYSSRKGGLVSASNQITKKQVEKLFGKKK